MRINREFLNLVVQILEAREKGLVIESGQLFDIAMADLRARKPGLTAITCKGQLEQIIRSFTHADPIPIRPPIRSSSFVHRTVEQR